MSVSPTYRSRLLPLLFLVGAVLSGISLWHFVKLESFPNAGPSFCNINPTFNCDAVTTSEYSIFLSLPLASWGLIFYLWLWVLHVGALDARRVPPSTAIDIQFLASLLASVFSVVLLAISEIMIGSICLLCVGMYLVNFGLLGVSWRLGRNRAMGDRLARAVRGLARFPAALAGRFRTDLPHSVIAGWGGVAIGGVILIGVIALPSSFFAALLAMQNERRAQQPIIPTAEAVIAEWRDQTLVEIPLTLRDGVEIDHGKGSPLAPVRIVEFLDYECPACRRLYLALDEIVRQYPEQVYVVLRNYPLDTECNPSVERELHKNACYAAIYARCAGEQGKFWDAADRLFTLEEFDRRASSEEIRSAIDKESEALGLDLVAMKECVDSPRHREKILDDIREGNVLGLEGTPSVWINNRHLPRPSPFAIKSVIDYILSGESKR